MSVGVFGEGVIDRFIGHTGSEDVIGGSALNAAVALRRAGIDSQWCARVSLDHDGSALAKYATVNGVASHRMLRREEPASIVTIRTNQDGIPTYEFQLEGAVDWQWTENELEESLRGLDVLQMSSLSCVLSPGADRLPAVLRNLKNDDSSLTVCFDPNARPRAAKDDRHAQQMKDRVIELVKLSDLVKVSDEDLEWLTPQASPEETARVWSQLGPQLVVLTRGSAGAMAFQSGDLVSAVPGVETSVVDTVGAGDTFMAWLLRGIVEDHANRIPQMPEHIEKLMAQAAAAAAITCSRKGCNPPLRSEVI